MNRTKRTFTLKQRALLTALLLWTVVLTAGAQLKADIRCIDFCGIPLEGKASVFATALKQKGFTSWGDSDDGEELHFRGNYYGIRVKLMVSTEGDSAMVQSALVTCGPYRTRENFNRNLSYFLMKLQQDYGQFSVRNGSYYYISDYGSIKLSENITANGARELTVFYLSTATFYKDAASMGLRGPVQQIVTENPIAEGAMMQFDRSGRLLDPELVDRQYDDYGYLTKAAMTEQQGGKSSVDYSYDQERRLVKRTLINATAGIKYVNEYTYNDDDEIASQSQKVFDKNGECIISISLKNKYTERDNNGNWTKNTLSLIYWEKGEQPQPATVEQTRTISYFSE
ncbi:MAG: hypothetical protein IJ710_00875 [Prevotella sp.]|nr:hypothetical protein [Prevotella sp.]